MKPFYIFFFALATGEKIIRNINLPSCKNCKFYKPDYSRNDFTSYLSTCEKFGEKNIFTDEITYGYASASRNNENKCGEEGKYFETERNIGLKIFKHRIVTNLPNTLALILLAFFLFVGTVKPR
jgi:hypothetical protein